MAGSEIQRVASDSPRERLACRRMHAADPDAMAEVVSLSVTNVSLQVLLDQIMADSGATCVVADGKIVVSPR